MHQRCHSRSKPSPCKVIGFSVSVGVDCKVISAPRHRIIAVSNSRSENPYITSLAARALLCGVQVANVLLYEYFVAFAAWMTDNLPWSTVLSPRLSCRAVDSLIPRRMKQRIIPRRTAPAMPWHIQCTLFFRMMVSNRFDEFSQAFHSEIPESQRS